MSETIDAQDVAVQVRHVAKLARITLTDEQAQRFGQQLRQILHYVEQLAQLDVSNVEPLAHALDVHNVFRDDVVGESLPAEVALREAPPGGRDGDFFQVPRVLE